MRRATGSAALAGGVALVVSLGCPWFSQRFTGVASPLRAERLIAGTTALGTGQLLLVSGAGVVAVACGVRGRRPGSSVPGLWLVAGGGLATIVEVAVLVERIGVDQPGIVSVTTIPSWGLAVAGAGAVAIVLAGLVHMWRPGERPTAYPDG